MSPSSFSWSKKGSRAEHDITDDIGCYCGHAYVRQLMSLEDKAAHWEMEEWNNMFHY